MLVLRWCENTISRQHVYFLESKLPIHLFGAKQKRMGSFLRIVLDDLSFTGTTKAFEKYMHLNRGLSYVERIIKYGMASSGFIAQKIKLVYERIELGVSSLIQ